MVVVETNGFMEGFFEQVRVSLQCLWSSALSQVEAIRAHIELIQHDVEEVARKHTEILSNPTNNPRAKNELDWLMADIKLTAKRVRAELKSKLIIVVILSFICLIGSLQWSRNR